MSGFFELMSGAQGVAQSTASASIACLWESALLVAGVWLVLKVVPRTTAAVRFAIWTAVFCVSAAMPVAGWVFGVQGQATGGDAHLQVDSRWSYLIAGVWALAAVARLVQLAVQGWKLRALWKRAVPVTDEALERMGCGELLAGRRVRVCTSEDVDRPSVIGFFAPKILVPSWLFAQLSEIELRHIVLHEMEHLRRRDDWMNLVQKIGLVVFPLNPALFWVDRRLAAERELACDDGVLRRTQMPRAYASCLASIAEMRLERRMHRRVVALALGLTGMLRGRSEFSRRIESIVGRRAVVSPRLAGAVAAVLVAAVLGAGIGLARTPQLVSFAPVGGAQRVAAAGGMTDGGGLVARARVREVSFRVPEMKSSEDLGVRSQVVPQRLKPRGRGGVYGTAEAVPLSKTGISMNAGGFARERHTPGAKAQVESVDLIAKAEALAYPEATTNSAGCGISAACKAHVESVDLIAKAEALAYPEPKTTLDYPEPKTRSVVREQWMVLTSFDGDQETGDAPARVVVRMPDGQFYVIPYAAVPVRNGWLIVQL